MTENQNKRSGPGSRPRDNGRTIVCYGCGVAGHLARECPSRDGRSADARRLRTKHKNAMHKANRDLDRSVRILQELVADLSDAEVDSVLPPRRTDPTLGEGNVSVVPRADPCWCSPSNPHKWWEVGNTPCCQYQAVKADDAPPPPTGWIPPRVGEGGAPAYVLPPTPAPDGAGNGAPPPPPARPPAPPPPPPIGAVFAVLGPDGAEPEAPAADPPPLPVFDRGAPWPTTYADNTDLHFADQVGRWMHVGRERPLYSVPGPVALMWGSGFLASTFTAALSGWSLLVGPLWHGKPWLRPASLGVLTIGAVSTLGALYSAWKIWSRVIVTPRFSTYFAITTPPEFMEAAPGDIPRDLRTDSQSVGDLKHDPLVATMTLRSFAPRWDRFLCLPRIHYSSGWLMVGNPDAYEVREVPASLALSAELSGPATSTLCTQSSDLWERLVRLAGRIHSVGHNRWTAFSPDLPGWDGAVLHAFLLTRRRFEELTPHLPGFLIPHVATYQEGGSIFMDTALVRCQSSNSDLNLRSMLSYPLSGLMTLCAARPKGCLLAATLLGLYCLTLTPRTVQLLWPGRENVLLVPLLSGIRHSFFALGCSFVSGCESTCDLLSQTVTLLWTLGWRKLTTPLGE